MSSKHSDHFLPFPTAVGGCQQDGAVLERAGGTTTRPHPCSASPQTPNASSLFCCAGGSALPWSTQGERLIGRVSSRDGRTGGQNSSTAQPLPLARLGTAPGISLCIQSPSTSPAPPCCVHTTMQWPSWKVYSSRTL